LTGNAAQILPPKMRHSGAVQVIQRARWMTSEQGLNIPTQHRDAYTVNGVFSEPFPTHAEALAAAREAAAEQRVPGHTEVIEYEDENGRWHTERASGRDRPETDVQDTN
jgi:hypothetical protein